MSTEVHITSLVVHAMPLHVLGVRGFIEALPGAQVHALNAEGKLVVTLEADSAGAMLEQVSLIQRAKGVLNAALVYQHADTLESMNKELDHADHPT